MAHMATFQSMAPGASFKTNKLSLHHLYGPSGLHYAGRSGEGGVGGD